MSDTAIGMIAPANAAPAGTPVCLSENINRLFALEVVAARSCELAGVTGP